MVAVGGNVPGTELLFDEVNHDPSDPKFADIQMRVHKGNHLILQPQPSLKDPNDPLRWNAWLKLVTYLNGCFFAFNGSMLGPLMSAGFLGLAKLYKRPLSDISQYNGSILITQGLGNIIWGPLAVKFGRRPVYLLSNLGQTLTCVWCALVVNKSYSSTLIARIFQGLFQAPVEALVPSTVADLFFTHERGSLVSYYGFSVLGGNNIGPIISAALIQRTGAVVWSFWLMTILCAVNWIGMFFFMPETKFTGERLNVEVSLAQGGGVVEAKDETTHIEIMDEKHARRSDIIEKKSFTSLLNPWSGTYPGNFLKIFLRPFVLCLYPTVLWSSTIYGLALGLHVILGVTIAQVFGGQYKFDSIAQGLVYVALAIGQLFGVFLSGPFSDWMANRLAYKNDGVREPEMRLPSLVFGAILTIVGTLVYGACLHHHTHWIGPVMGLAIQSAGCQNLANVAITYSVDSHRELSTDLMVTVASIKSAIAYIFTWVSNDWLVSSGPLEMYGTLAGVTAALCLTTIPLYFYGKNIRTWLHEKQLLRHLDSDDL